MLADVAQILGYTVVAEGTEIEKTLGVLGDIGCLWARATCSPGRGE
jgi:hypothetical protein